VRSNENNKRESGRERERGGETKECDRKSERKREKRKDQLDCFRKERDQLVFLCVSS
jgi:hypothetical protein